MKVNSIVLAVAALPLILACSDDSEPDAYGNFEAVEVVVSAQTTGQVERFVPEEGMYLEELAHVAVIDTAQLVLERNQLAAQRAATGAREREVREQLQVLDVQREVALRVLERTRRLHDRKAATTQQLDQAEREYRVLVAQMDAVRAQKASVRMDVTSGDARVRQLEDRLERSRVTNPVAGTVLATYTRQGEMVQAGQPLYKVASLDTLELRVYVTGVQLEELRLGQQVAVNITGADAGLREYPGTVSWIASSAEFTPTPVQTRDERADLVYAVKIRVPNESGALKIGMPADVSWTNVTSSGESP
ncbi:MAG TPA: HlyD family efflux transporter periplasmic adaptor subunit [Gemmatimonadales bacterium]|nr:HlyD family efflux transporter periplasmic adaptor subunit [Gemmatimonadales bacterium]